MIKRLGVGLARFDEACFLELSQRRIDAARTRREAPHRTRLEHLAQAIARARLLMGEPQERKPERRRKLFRH